MTLPQNLFFDLDGTLTDPKEGIVNCLRFALQEMGREAPANEQLLQYIGPPLRESFSQLLNTNNRKDIECAIERYRARFSDIGMFENVVYDGIPDVLNTVGEEGITAFVVTSKAHVFAQRILEHFNLSRFFKKVYGPELDGTLNDKAELISFVLKEQAIDCSTCVMIGDRKYDITGAKTNGVRSLGVTYGYGSVSELTSAGADSICHSPSEIPGSLAFFR